MKVPSEIKRKMYSAANHYQKGAAIMREIEEWFESHGIDPDDLRSGDGRSLEEIEYGNDVVDKFCDWFKEVSENGVLKRGMHREV